MYTALCIAYRTYSATLWPPSPPPLKKYQKTLLAKWASQSDAYSEIGLGGVESVILFFEMWGEGGWIATQVKNKYVVNGFSYGDGGRIYDFREENIFLANKMTEKIRDRAKKFGSSTIKKKYT